MCKQGKNNFKSPLHMASVCGSGYMPLVRFIVENVEGVLNADENGLTPIHQAALEGHVEVVKLLAIFTENPNAPCIKSGVTPINLAAMKGHIEIVKILAALTENPNVPEECGMTSIYMAAMNGHIEVVKFLAAFTDNPNVPDENGWTPIHRTAYNGHAC